MFRYEHERPDYHTTELQNSSFSLCYSCGEFAVWVSDDLIFPARTYTFKPHPDMPAEIATDFNEAASIVDLSPRGAAALLRLCIQKLMPILGEKGKNIDEDIGSLVKKGLDVSIQEVLDIVRVIGNNAVHPGQIELRDDKGTAATLFDLVNMIVERMISVPKKTKELFKRLPAGARAAIEKRDKKP